MTYEEEIDGKALMAMFTMGSTTFLQTEGLSEILDAGPRLPYRVSSLNDIETLSGSIKALADKIFSNFLPSKTPGTAPFMLGQHGNVANLCRRV